MKPAVITFAGCCLTLIHSADAESTRISQAELYRMDLVDVPDVVQVTDTLDAYGRVTLDALAFILDELPESWEYQGEGGLTVSDRYSRAGAKSIRWNWNAGDSIRIRNLGVLTRVRTHVHLTSGNNVFVPPFEIHCFQEEPLPENARFDIYFKRVERQSDDVRLLRLSYCMNYAGTWYKMGANYLPNLESALPKSAGLSNLDMIESMPDGLAEPDENEIILQAPTDVESGVFYLDRLIVPAELPTRETVTGGLRKYLDYTFEEETATIEFRALPVNIISEPDIVTLGIPQSPFDPTSFNQNSPNYYGYFAEKPPVPEVLTGEQQVYIDGLRQSWFQPPEPLPPESDEYRAIESWAKAVLERDCVELPDGRFRFRETINYAGMRPWLAGELYDHRKYTDHLPAGVEPQEIYIRHLYATYANWYVSCPDSKPVEALLKAWLDWFQYQVINPPVGSEGFSGRYAGDAILNSSRDLIAVLRDQGTPDDLKYAEYVGRLCMWCGRAHASSFARDERPGAGKEIGIPALSFYYSTFFEPDDRTFFQFLNASRDTWTNAFSISVFRNHGMIKPDYTFYHHGHVSYWHGNFLGYMDLADQFARTPLDFDPEIRRTLAWHATRYTFGALAAPGNIKGGQVSDFGFYQYKHDLLNNRAVSEFGIDNLPRRDVFEYFYNMDWEEVPAARKYLAGVLGMAEYRPTEVRERWYEEYPRLREIDPQPDIHLSINWTGAAVYNRGFARVHVGGYNDKDSVPSRPEPRWSWNRGYGALYVSENDRTSGRPPLGASHEGYSWSKAPGITMPAVTDEEYIQYQELELSTAGGPGNGALTFNETEEQFGRYGNFSFQSLPDENTGLWALFDVDGFEGKKSYHFYRDQVVCLGSDYRANSRRPMETILFQEGIDEDVIWRNRNPLRWNPDRPTLVVNGEAYTDDMTLSVSLEDSNYVISPFGHAWIIPARQEGRLRIEWKERETLYRYRISEQGVNPGQRMTTGTNAIAWIDHGPSRNTSSHHYCLLLNSDGKSPAKLEEYAIATQRNLNYDVLRQDGVAHAVRFRGGDDENAVCSYVVFAPDEDLNLPYVRSTNRRLNIMIQEDEAGDFVMSVCDPFVNINRDPESPDFERSEDREIQVAFQSHSTVHLLASTSGLPQTNPPLDARIENNTLIFTTRNGVTDTFRLRAVRE